MFAMECETTAKKCSCPLVGSRVEIDVQCELETDSGANNKLCFRPVTCVETRFNQHISAAVGFALHSPRDSMRGTACHDPSPSISHPVFLLGPCYSSTYPGHEADAPHVSHQFPLSGPKISNSFHPHVTFQPFVVLGALGRH